MHLYQSKIFCYHCGKIKLKSSTLKVIDVRDKNEMISRLLLKASKYDTICQKQIICGGKNEQEN